MIFNMAGDGDALNFKLVGNPQPASPKDNTIWINTDTPIPNYYFGDAKPFELSLALQFDGEYGKIDGTIVEDPNYVTKIFHIPTGTQEVWVVIDNYSASNAAHWFLDKDGTVVSFFPRQAGYDIVDVPDNAVYVALSVRNTEFASAFADINLDINIEEGTVWIPTGTFSAVAFNALKKNIIVVCPISAKQFINGAWVDKEAKSYQGGKWVDWIVHLYNKGDDCTGVTGGWSAIKIAPGAGGFGTTGTYVANYDGFTLTANSTGTSISRVTNNMIDLTNVSAIYMDVINYTGSSALFLSCGKQKSFDTEVAKAEQKSTGTIVLDVSGLTGSYYISATLSCYVGQSGSTAKITQIWYK